MLLSRRHHYLFVHVYKVAGQSVKLALRRHDYRMLPGLRTPLALLVESPPAYALRPISAHASAAEIRDWLGEEEFSRLYRFSFVRNPWDWQVSLYHFIQRNRFNRHRSIVADMRSFDDYLRWRIDAELHTQSEYLCDEDGRLLVDFVGRYESLERDFAHICGRIGIAVDLPHANATAHRPYQEYYSDRTADLVARAFAEDIERFGYTFDGHERHDVLPDRSR